MINKEQIQAKILEVFPSFKTDDEDLPYVAAGDLARYLLDLYQVEKLENFPKFAKLIEDFHTDGDEYVKKYATIGILEGIQNVWGNNDADPENFVKFLLPVSKQYWDSLNKFWNSEIPIVGSDIKNT